MHALGAMTRSWPMLAALGAGLVLLALAAGAAGAMLFVLAGLGIASLGWSVAALRAGRVIAPGVVLAVTAGALVGAGALVASGVAADADVPVGPLAAASVFTVVVALGCAPALRRRRSFARAARPAAPTPAGFDGRSLLGLIAGAALVAALATPALAATEAGEHAVPHGTHQIDGEHPPSDHAPAGHTN